MTFHRRPKNGNSGAANESRADQLLRNIRQNTISELMATGKTRIDAAGLVDQAVKRMGINALLAAIDPEAAAAKAKAVKKPPTRAEVLDEILRVSGRVVYGFGNPSGYGQNKYCTIKTGLGPESTQNIAVITATGKIAQDPSIFLALSKHNSTSNYGSKRGLPGEDNSKDDYVEVISLIKSDELGVSILGFRTAAYSDRYRTLTSDRNEIMPIWIIPNETAAKIMDLLIREGATIIHELYGRSHPDFVDTRPDGGGTTKGKRYITLLGFNMKVETESGIFDLPRIERPDYRDKK